MKVIVVGGTGLLGQQLVFLLKQKKFDVYATYHSEPINKDGFFMVCFNVITGSRSLTSRR